MKKVTIKQAAEMLLEHNNIIILMHKSPDGDAIGCAYALCAALRRLGKKVQPLCSDPIPAKYGYITDSIEPQSFDVQYVVTVDLADTQLFGDKLEMYKDRVDLCIDHHGSNTSFAEYGIVDPGAGACAQIVAKILDAMGAEIDPLIADAIFTGITTDTGCFKYSNATAESYRIAADMMDKGAQNAMINRVMFDTKSRARLEAEKLALASVRFYGDGKIATISVTKKMLEISGADESDTEGIASIPRQIEGVKAGITIKEKDDGAYRISMRTTDDVDSSAICGVFGGGGHRAAAGCMIKGTAEEVERKIVAEAAKAIGCEV